MVRFWVSKSVCVGVPTGMVSHSCDRIGGLAADAVAGGIEDVQGDARGGAVLPGAIAGGAALGRRRHLDARQLVERRAEDDSGAACLALAGGIDGALLLEIGRASCGERVW